MDDTRTYSHFEIQRYLQRKMSQQEMHDFEKALNEHESEITPQFVEILGNLMMQMDQQQGQKQMSPDDIGMLSKIEALYKAALKWQMKKNVG